MEMYIKTIDYCSVRTMGRFSIRSSHQRCSVRKGVLRNFAKFLNFFKRETLAQVFSCELCKISKDIFVTEHLRASASIDLTLD